MNPREELTAHVQEQTAVRYTQELVAIKDDLGLGLATEAEEEFLAARLACMNRRERRYWIRRGKQYRAAAQGGRFHT